VSLNPVYNLFLNVQKNRKGKGRVVHALVISLFSIPEMRGKREEGRKKKKGIGFFLFSNNPAENPVLWRKKGKKKRVVYFSHAQSIPLLARRPG